MLRSRLQAAAGLRNPQAAFSRLREHAWITPSLKEGNRLLRVASTDGLVNQMADGVLRVASTDELLYQMADGLLRVASTDVIKTKNPASPRGYFFALYNIHFFFFFSSDFFPDSDFWTCVGWFLGGQESSNPKTQQVWEGSFLPSTTLLIFFFSISQRFSHFWGATFTSKTILGSKRGKTRFFFSWIFFRIPLFPTSLIPTPIS